MFLQTISEKLFNNYGIRYIRKQKNKFASFIIEELSSLGWDSEIVEGRRFLVKNRNVVTKLQGEPEIIIMAHYDTPPKMPYILSLFFKIVGHSFLSMMITSMLLLFIFNIISKLSFISPLVNIIWLVVVLIFIITMFLPNKKNYNDNSSGVLALLNIANTLKDNPILKNKIQLVFLDNEEWGMLGSSFMRKYYLRNNINLKNKNIINFDCVGKGTVPMVCYSKKPNSLSKNLYEYLKDKNENVIHKKLILSDHYSFKKYSSVGITFTNPALLPKQYVIPNLHTKQDDNVELDKIKWISEEVINLILEQF